MADDLTVHPSYRATMDGLESLRRVAPNGSDYWHAREIGPALGYPTWDKFTHVIDRAMAACDGVQIDPAKHFSRTSKVLGGGHVGEDFFISRAAAYLIAMNGDPTKPEIAAAQAYFTIQTRRMELAEMADTEPLPATEDERRVLARDEMKVHNRKLAGAAKSVGVKTPVEYAVFQNHGYKGLYAGLDMRGIQRRKKLEDRQDILDHMPSAELAANLFRATQTAEQLERMKDKGVTGKEVANRTHFNIGQKVRQTIKDIGGTMPEDYPAVEHVKEARKRVKAASKPPRLPKPKKQKVKPSTET